MIQFYAPGIPQVYYVGLLAGKNDMELLTQTRVGRDINRHYYSRKEVEEELSRPIVKKLIELIRFRNSYPAFQGEFELEETSSEVLSMRWKTDSHQTTLQVNLVPMTFSLTYSLGNKLITLDNNLDFTTHHYQNQIS